VHGPRRWWTPARLLTALVLVAWGGGAQALTERFATARAVLGDPDTARTYQGWTKALLAAGLRLAEAAAAWWRGQMSARAGSAWTLYGWCVLAADGSRFALPRTAELLRVFGFGGRDESQPQLWITTLWHLGLGLPWAWRIGRADASERRHLAALLPDTPPNCLLVADAGYVGYELLRQIVGSGRHFLVRVGRNVHLLTHLGYAQVERGHTVYLWPAYAQRQAQPPLGLRLIRLPVGPKGQPVCLLTSVTDPARLSDEQAGVLYRLRWGIELMYRSLKQTLQARTLRSTAPAQVLFEMHGLMLGLMLLGLWTTRAIQARGGRPGGWSVAGALQVVRRALRRPDTPQPWTDRLAHAVPDRYLRRRKVRVIWPRKKQHDPPPGCPNVRPATATERRAALALRGD